jgi:hypothetical protein
MIPCWGESSIHRDEPFAKLYYLAPSSQLEHPYLPDLIENLAEHAGTWGAFHVLAEVDETNDAFVALRKSGFSVYAWQRMWDVSDVDGTGCDVQLDAGQICTLTFGAESLSSDRPAVAASRGAQPRAAVGWMCNEAQSVM